MDKDRPADQADTSVEQQMRTAKKKKQREDRIHLFISLALVGMSYIFYSDYASFREKAPRLNIDMRDMTDLIYIVLSAAVMFVLRRLLNYFIRPFMERRLMTLNLPEIDHGLRKEKLIRQVFDAIYYTAAFFYGRAVASDLDFIPEWVGGTGTCDSLGMYWPKMKFHQKMRLYIIIQFGHHLHNLVYHTIAMKHVGNYFEMITHHYAAVVSLFYSYFTNWEDYAYIILNCHDLSDGILNFGKVVRDLGYEKSKIYILELTYLSLAVSWFYHRTVVIGGCYFYKTYDYYWWKSPFPGFEDLWSSVKRGVNFIVLNIFIIWVLNISWWIQIVKMGVTKFVKKGKFVSTHEGEMMTQEQKKDK